VTDIRPTGALIGLGISEYQAKRYEGRMSKGGFRRRCTRMTRSGLTSAAARRENVLEPRSSGCPVTTQASE